MGLTTTQIRRKIWTALKKQWSAELATDIMDAMAIRILHLEARIEDLEKKLASKG